MRQWAPRCGNWREGIATLARGEFACRIGFDRDRMQPFLVRIPRCVEGKAAAAA